MDALKEFALQEGGLPSKKSAFALFFELAKLETTQRLTKAKDFLGRKGLYISGGLKIFGNSAAATGTITQSIPHLMNGTLSFGETAVTTALVLCITAFAISSLPVDAVALKEHYTDQEKKRIKLRNTIIKTAATLDLVASTFYLAAGIALHNPGLGGAACVYLAAAYIRGHWTQGKDVAKPVFDETTPRLERWKGKAGYYQEFYKNNPNKFAELIAMPGLVSSCIGLALILPLWEIAPISAILITGSICRYYTNALHEAVEKKSPNPSRPPEQIPERQGGPKQ